ncbi:MAG: alpha,alpha-trehalose-phosphate synthase (UDP-forming) [Alphaproteobacteria bacterium]|nr:alpha,alpha-trehalose-phosphate synthase (UDP-forming) [Alphaproteobacteria bacterium]
MTGDSRLVVVSNRVAAGKRAAAGGLAVALRDALADSGGLWFGWSGRTVESEPKGPQITHNDGISFATIDLSAADYSDYYKGFSNRTLWPLFHYRIDLTAFDRGFHSGYVRVNARFADALAPLLRPDDLVWVHDYHLIALGHELRRLGARQRLGFFLHIPFPATEVLLTLPTHRELVQALFAYDLVGFQAPSDLRAFRDYVTVEAGGRAFEDGRISAFGRTIRADVFPIGIDTANFAALAGTQDTERYRQRMIDSAGGSEIIIGVDRLDYSKGLTERFAAFEALLTAYPENRGRVGLLQIAPPSRADVPEYIRLRRELEAAAGRINGRFAEFDWVPIRYLNRPFARPALAALYRLARVGLVTPYRDGMNLVAKEYVAAQDPANPGVLVLSRFAGAAQQLDDALIVNPYDVQGVADAIQRALKMDLAERERRWRAMMTTLEHDDLTAWRARFVDALAAIAPPVPFRPTATGTYVRALDPSLPEAR